MALIVEDGSGILGADSYSTLEEARAYALSRGLVLPELDTLAEVQLRVAFDYIESLGSRYTGQRTLAAQITQWPRKYVYIDCAELDPAIVPLAVKQAQVHLAAAIQSGVNLFAVSDGSAAIVREKVGEIETEYKVSAGSSSATYARVIAADRLLSPLLRDGGMSVTVQRV